MLKGYEKCCSFYHGTRHRRAEGTMKKGKFLVLLWHTLTNEEITSYSKPRQKKLEKYQRKFSSG